MQGAAKIGKAWRRAALCGLVCLSVATPLPALESLTFQTPGADKSLRSTLEASSLLLQAQRSKSVAAQDLFAAARADYGRILAALYAEGYYSGVIRIQIDGREASAIAPLDAPAKINTIVVGVTPGPQFRFSRATATPLADGTEMPKGFVSGEIARSGEIVDAAGAAVLGWRQAGHAKARVTGQSVQADHRSDTLAADLSLTPGPRVRFGALSISGNERMRSGAIERITGYPTGEIYDPDALDAAARRLRRTGIFRTVAFSEAATLGPGDTMEVGLAVDEAMPRRLGFGAEINSMEGLTLSGFWLHRNLLGGGERLRIDGEVGGIGGQTGGEDYSFGARLDRPGTLGPNTSGFTKFRAEKLDETDYSAENLSFGIGITRTFGEFITAEVGIGYLSSSVEDAGGTSDFRALELPLSASWDNRDSALDATRGYFLLAEAKPFLGFSGTGSGARLAGDARAYRAFGEEARVVLAGRLQFGAIVGSAIEDTPRDYLFYSGGGGTVRGHPYKSLGVTELNGGTVRSGGTSFLGISGELRADITAKIGVVGFYDAGFVGGGDLFSNGEWHAGAGLGLRYNTGIGPIRLDLAAPVSGSTGDGMQIYVGIGQAF